MECDFCNFFIELYNTNIFFDVQICDVNSTSRIYLNIAISKLLFVALIITFLLAPKINFSQAPPLGATSSFAIFTAVGAINNIGTTIVTGDVGTDAGAFTGFPPGIIVGATHTADAVSAQAAIDVDAAYNSLAAVSCGLVIGTDRKSVV